MIVFIMEVKLRAVWVHSLKEKRMIVKSIVQKLKNQFNISVAEIDEQDIHQIVVIGIAGICLTQGQVDATMEHIIHFIETHCQAEIIDIQKEFY